MGSRQSGGAVVGIDWEKRREGKQQKGCKINKYILENETLYIITHTHTPLKLTKSFKT